MHIKCPGWNWYTCVMTLIRTQEVISDQYSNQHACWQRNQYSSCEYLLSHTNIFRSLYCKSHFDKSRVGKLFQTVGWKFAVILQSKIHNSVPTSALRHLENPQQAAELESQQNAGREPDTFHSKHPEEEDPSVHCCVWDTKTTLYVWSNMDSILSSPDV